VTEERHLGKAWKSCVFLFLFQNISTCTNLTYLLTRTVATDVLPTTKLHFVKYLHLITTVLMMLSITSMPHIYYEWSKVSIENHLFDSTEQFLYISLPAVINPYPANVYKMVGFCQC
jgi:hypothetical protein